jgi:RNA recognition motif-containing protein
VAKLHLLQKEISMNIYVGNLSNEVSEEDLRHAFEAFGKIESASLIKDRDSGRSKGFGFVEMASKQEGQAAMEGLNGTELKGKALAVNEARPRDAKRGGKGGFKGGKSGGHGDNKSEYTGVYGGGKVGGNRGR